MPSYIEKTVITIVGTGTPMWISNMFAHRVIDDDTSRIMLLSTIGGELNHLQHFGHNSRVITITGRINLSMDSDFRKVRNVLALKSPEALITGLKLLKETKSGVLVIMNHSICYGVIRDFKIIDDEEYPTSFDYECVIIEKDLFGLKFSAISQRIFSVFMEQRAPNKRIIVDSGKIIPSFVTDDFER